MAPRRPRSTSNVSASNTISRAPTSSPQLRKQYALAFDSIYQHNLNVIKRRDPSIVSILDQFSHVCLYNFDGKAKKWLREGHEGSIFIVEHRDSPIYGFYILNRLGTGDYSRRIYPEDDVEILGNYLMYRYYSDYTQKRLASGLPYPLPPQVRPVFDAEFAKDKSLPDEPETPVEPGIPPKEKKGTSMTIGLWQFPQDGRVESLKDVMPRLHSYVQKGQPYPEQYCYGPGHPPPPPSNGQGGQSSGNPSLTKEASRSGSTQPVPGSEVDQLFAKLHAPATGNPLGGAVQNLYNSIAGQSGSSLSQASIPSTSSMGSSNAIPSNTSVRGLALLDTIFASALPPGHHSTAPSSFPTQPPTEPQPTKLPSEPEMINIVSPKPQSSALPQILTQNVISTLLGLDPASASSRSSSAALSSGSSRRSGNKRYEGDNELSEADAGSDAGFSTSSTVLDTDVDPAILARGSPQIPSLSYPSETGDFVQGPLSVQGDVTPRAPARCMDPMSPLLAAQRSGQSLLSVSGLLSAAAETARSTNNLSSASNRLSNSGSPVPQRSRQLVPFSSDHELWPYPRAPLNDNDSSEADVVELDFSDTRALSDPSLFDKKQSKQAKGERRKKNRKERAAERQRDREAIESGWDDPTKGQVTLPGSTPTSTTSSLSLSAMMQAAAAETAGQSLANGKENPVANGQASSSVHPITNGANGHAMTPADIARETLLSTLSIYPKAPPRDLDRKRFVQEVLSLIYTDNTFVDKLYEQYANGGHP